MTRSIMMDVMMTLATLTRTMTVSAQWLFALQRVHTVQKRRHTHQQMALQHQNIVGEIQQKFISIWSSNTLEDQESFRNQLAGFVHHGSRVANEFRPGAPRLWVQMKGYECK